MKAGGAPTQGPALQRAELADRTRAVLNVGRFGNPDVLLVDAGADAEEELVVVKDFAARSRIVRRLLGRWLLRREARAYARLEGVPAVPRLLGRIDADALILEYRPGIMLSRSLAGTLPDAFMQELVAAVEEMHARGIVHLDLRHRSNLLAGEDGHPVMIDFASALFFDRASAPGRLMQRLFARIDLAALEKWRVRLVP